MSVERGLQYVDLKNLQSQDIYEFGVYNGNSLRIIKRFLKLSTVGFPNKVYGFDSFEGCPLEEKDIRSAKVWCEGFMNVTKEKYQNGETPEQVCNIIENSIKSKDFKLKLIKGFFNKLDSEVCSNYDMKSACYVNIDCDQYTSTFECLDFLFKNNLIQKGCVIRYDDWNGGLLYDDDVSDHGGNTYKEYITGQSLAHREICDKYHINAEKVHHDNPLVNWKGKAIFKII